MLSQQVLQSLERAREIYLTTFDDGGKPGSVPVWFVLKGGEVLVTTNEGTKKVQKIRKNNRVVITPGKRENPLKFEGRAEIITDKAKVLETARLIEAKYRWHLPDDPQRVLLEITLVG